MINIAIRTLDCSDFNFRIYFRSGLWNVVFEEEGELPELECRFKSKTQALEYVGLRLINYYGGV